MITDSLFYRLFDTSPETLFLVLGKSLDEARKLAAQYQFLAIEFKDIAHRADGVFQPKEAGLPVYFVEFQHYRRPEIYADILVKAYTYLKKNDSVPDYCAVVLFRSRSIEPENLRPFEPLLNSGHLRRIFLNEVSSTAEAPLGMSILHLIGQPAEPAVDSAKALLKRTRSEISDPPLQASLLELIETVIIYKLPHLSREEIQAMLEVNDIRETRVYQEAQEEERERILQESIPRLIEEGLTIAQIARVFKLEVSEVEEAANRLSGQ